MADAEVRPSAPTALLGPLLRASKLNPPRGRSWTLERERLIRTLERSGDASIVVVSASAGYGKSTLASAWSRRRKQPVAWVNVDRGDNDPIVFLNAIAYALDGIDAVSPELLAELSSPRPRVDEFVLPTLAAELARLAPLTLVLDDAHELTQPRSLSALAFLLAEIPAKSQLALVTREDFDHLHLASRRAAGELVEIRAEALAFDHDETRALASSLEVSLSDEALERLVDRTEGWPAGIALALHAMREHAESVDDLINGDQREIADYLVEVVLSQTPEEQQRFLLATSILKRMSAPVCDAVLETSDSANQLRELERSNSFVIALDETRSWYRYHHLFGELLRAELDRRNPELASVYLARAAEWHEQDGGDPGEAFRCARECGDFERAGRIALGRVDRLSSLGQTETVHLWLLDCSDDEIASDSQLSLAAGWVYGLLGEPDLAQRFVAAAEQGELDGPSADGATSVRVSLANVRSALGIGGIGRMLADSEFVYAAEKKARTRWFLGGARGRGIALLLLGRPEEAIEPLREALVLTGAGPELAHVRLFMASYLALALADAGRWPEARKTAQEARALAMEARFERTMDAALAHTAGATVLVHDGDFDRAAAELATAMLNERLVRGALWLSADMSLRWGEIGFDLGQRPAAREHAGHARAVLEGYPDPGAMVTRLEALEQRIRSASGPGPDTGRDPDAAVPPDAPHDTGDRSPRLPLPRDGEDSSLLDLRQARRDDAVGGRRADGAARPRIVPRLGIPAILAEEIASRPVKGSRAVTVKEYLTPAESQVLAYLPTHLTIEEIGVRLGRSRSTVKTHIAGIYEKLGAGKRSEAVDRARELGLLAGPRE